jgi:hypothetical protein
LFCSGDLGRDRLTVSSIVRKMTKPLAHHSLPPCQLPYLFLEEVNPVHFSPNGKPFPPPQPISLKQLPGETLSILRFNPVLPHTLAMTNLSVTNRCSYACQSFNQNHSHRTHSTRIHTSVPIIITGLEVECERVRVRSTCAAISALRPHCVYKSFATASVSCRLALD